MLFACRRLGIRSNGDVDRGLDNDVGAGRHSVRRYGNNAGSAAAGAGALQDRIPGSVEWFVRRLQCSDERQCYQHRH